MTIDLRYGDTIEQMKFIPDKSIDMIFCDLPYGTTACKWDSVIPFKELWEQYERIIKPNKAIVLTASQPFTSALVMSNPKLFKYEWIWQKTRFSGNLNATRMPLKAHESVLVFAKIKAPYYPIKTEAPEHLIDRRKNVNPSIVKDGGAYNGSKGFVNIRKKDDGTRYPTTIQAFKNPNNNSLHPTQKPIELVEYFIKTHSNENDTVLDNTFGSCTTGIACINTNRNFIGIENNMDYFNISLKRVEEKRKEKDFNLITSFGDGM
jgi:site-specific DNA-methyltransferase (adenine-specific)